MAILSNNKGFTIVEILLAFFIFSILLVTIYASYAGSFNTINLTEARMEIYRKAAISLDRISEDLQASYISNLPADSFGEPVEYTRFMGEDNDIDGREADSLSFFARIDPLFTDESTAATGQLIVYDVIEGEEEDGLVLLRSEYPEFADEVDDREGMVLCDGLQSVAFTYFNSDAESMEGWDSDSEEQNGSLPSMVSVSLEFLNRDNPDAPLKFMTNVSLPMQYRPAEEED
jgi:type II secretory pathway pseudopilin PulG